MVVELHVNYEFLTDMLVKLIQKSNVCSSKKLLNLMKLSMESYSISPLMSEPKENRDICKYKIMHAVEALNLITYKIKWRRKSADSASLDTEFSSSNFELLSDT